MTNIITKISDLKKDIHDSNRIVFLTGAGVSTNSGIPDYRSKNGLYSSAENPEYILSHENLSAHPAAFYDFVIKNMFFPNAHPNIIHKKIAAITNKKGMLITQNVDDLDKKAGNKHVIEFHGNLYNLFCQKCQQKIPFSDYQQSYIHGIDGGVIRPEIVLYNEQIGPEKIMEAVDALQNADLIIIVGTSFRVYPFAQLLEYRQLTAKVWIINQEIISESHNFNSIIGDASTVFKEI